MANCLKQVRCHIEKKYLNCMTINYINILLLLILKMLQSL